MRGSNYNVYFQNKKKYYIYNILSTGILETSKEINNSLKSNNFDSLTNDDLNYLKNAGYIVEKNVNESELYREYYEGTRYRDSGSDLRITFIPTYKCNLKCPYCYEGQNKNNSIIKKENTDKIVHFIENTIKESAIPIKRLTISLFGGEPTLCYDSISSFCSKVDKLASKYNTELYFGMTTNFTIVNENLLSLIKKYNINTQVTIDGTKEHHDTRRITIAGKGTYDIIVNNLKKAVSFGLKDLITIRINTDENNLEGCESVFEEMIKYSNDVYFGILNSYKDRNDSYGNNCLIGASINKAFIEKLLLLYKKHNLEIPVKFGKQNPCSINTYNKFMIDLNLNVYKCDLLLNIDEYKVGVINDDGCFEKNNNYYNQMSSTPFKYQKCVKCKFLPMCARGCPGERILKEGIRNGDIPPGYCEINETILVNYLKSYVELVD